MTLQEFHDYLVTQKKNIDEGNSNKTYFMAINDALYMYLDEYDLNWEAIRKHWAEEYDMNTEHEAIKNIIGNFIDEVHDGAYDGGYPIGDEAVEDYFDYHYYIKYENL